MRDANTINSIDSLGLLAQTGQKGMFSRADVLKSVTNEDLKVFTDAAA